MGAQWSQFFPPRPTFTEADVKSQEGKVFLVTGGYSGIGFELSKMLYSKNGRVYIAGRDKDAARQAINAIQSAIPGGKGSLEFLHLELDDLSSIKASVEEFKAKESKLNVLWNNAGVSQPPLGSVSKQGIELQLAVNCLGPFLMTQLLLPVLQATATHDEEPGSVRVVWTSSQIVELSAPPGGLITAELHSPPKDQARNYVNSKMGNWFLASELARQVGSSHIISVSQNPGAAATNLLRHSPWLRYVAWPLFHTAVLAAHTELYAGLSKDITLDKNGCYIIPWGRIATEPREDLLHAMKSEEEGGSGRAKEFRDWCFEMTHDYC